MAWPGMGVVAALVDYTGVQSLTVKRRKLSHGETAAVQLDLNICQVARRQQRRQLGCPETRRARRVLSFDQEHILHDMCSRFRT